MWTDRELIRTKLFVESAKKDTLLVILLTLGSICFVRKD